MIPLKDMDFKKNMPGSTNKKLIKSLKELKPFTKVEIFNMMSKIDAKNKTCALFTLIHPFNSKYKNPTEVECEFQGGSLHESDNKTLECDEPISNSEFLILTNMFTEKYASMELNELVAFCNSIDLKFKTVDIEAIEKATKKQSSSSSWYEFRAGRITASNFKSVCRTSIERPAASLVKKICYPETCKFTSAATEYGKRNESVALTKYKDQMMSVHENFVLHQSGLILNNNFPGFSASPDGISVCDCHGKIVLEIKCPFSGKNGSIESVLSLKVPYIRKITNGNNKEMYVMVESHAYYYQVQMLIFMTESIAAHFVIWTPNDLILIVVEPNYEFWTNNYKTAEIFLRKIILPEILGKIYTRKLFIKEK